MYVNTWYVYIYIYWCRHGSSWRFYLPPLWVATELLQPCCSRTTRVMLWTHTPPFDATIWSRWETERTQLQSWVLGPGCSGILQVCSGSMPHLQVWIIWGLWNLWIIPGKGYYTNHYTILYIIIRYYTGYTQKQPTTVSAGKDFFNNAWCAIGRRQVPQEISAGDSGDFEMEGLSCGLVSRW